MKEFKELLKQAKRFANEDNIVLYMSGTKRKKTAYEKLLLKFVEDFELDYELGVIDNKKYECEKRIASILEKSLENYNIY